MHRTLLAIATITMLVLTGCGGEDADAANAISESLMDQDGDLLTVEREDADCIGEEMVDEIGVQELKKYGYLDEDGTVAKDPIDLELSAHDAEVMTDVLFRCTDMMATMRRSMAGDTAEQDPAVKKCIDEVMTEDRVRSMFTSLFSGDQQEATDELTAPMTKCATKALGR